ncbi:MAG: DUF4827 domain-containing protein [Candidatus Azobacteroides sp.]|nr:DUF4827 domain-containing protein [Candidatus Azobacteroides sp.]
MKKWILNIVLVAVVCCISFSCNQGKSLQELLQEERKAIDKFITMNDLVILKEYPKDGVFKDNEYFRTGEGLFLQVVDSGNGIRVQSRNDVSVRYDYYQSVKSAASGDTITYPFPYSSAGYQTAFQPYSFTFGIPQTYSSAYSPVCQAWIIPLAYVGEGAVLNLIIPSSLGSYRDNSDITPAFYKKLCYTRFN